MANKLKPIEELKEFLNGPKFFVYKVDGSEELKNKYEGRVIFSGNNSDIDGHFIPEHLFVSFMDDYAKTLEELLRLKEKLNEIKIIASND
ncbi:MAG: hypothetical protein AABY22_11895 [Nanoarchaeota archaeon]